MHRPRPMHVLGRGAVSCFGAGVEVLLDAVFDGRSGIGPLRRFPAVDEIAHLAAELPDSVVAASDGRSLPRRIAALAATEALAEAEVDAAACAMILATTKADLSGVEGAGAGRGSPALLLDQLVGDLGIAGPTAAVSCACASGLSALALGSRWLANDRVAAVLVVGVDVLSDFVLRGFRALLALDPQPCRPFDRRRAGLTLGEGAGAMLLGVQPGKSRVRMLGCGESNDAHGITAPAPDGNGLLRAARAALAAAGMTADEVDYVHLHGTGTIYNDAMECAAMQRLFTTAPPLSGSKAQIGHTLGAAGVLESLIAIEALRRGTAPANIGLEQPDAPDGFPLLRNTRPLRRAATALKVAAGFGGINAALVFGR